MTAPFTDAPRTEVLTRVAYAWIARTYRRMRHLDIAPTEYCSLALDSLPALMSADLRLAVLGLTYHVYRGRPARQWRQEAILLAREGHTLRRCVYSEYKGNRRDPRVTNRGVRQRVRR